MSAVMRDCNHCSEALPVDAHFNRRFCDDKPCKARYGSRRLIEPINCPVCAAEFWPIVRGWAGCLARTEGPFIGFPCSDECRYVQFRAYQSYYLTQKLTPEKKAEWRAVARAWRDDNNMGAFYTQEYRARKAQRTPAWSDMEAIEVFYRECAKGMAVDHIVPLHGEKVSGLHVIENLQYLTPLENSTKHNTFVV